MRADELALADEVGGEGRGVVHGTAPGLMIGTKPVPDVRGGATAESGVFGGDWAESLREGATDRLIARSDGDAGS